ncbi:MAG: phosphoglycerate kinase [Candidatus Omnitrophota bacterium]
MAKLTLKDLDLKDKKVLIRCDFNVPLDDNLNITDDTRIRESLATIKYVLEKLAKKVILMSHLGRPEGKVVDRLRLNPVANRLKSLLGISVKKLDDCVGPGIKSQVDSSLEKVILLENLRFHPEEEKNDPDFAKELSVLGDIYINDAFGTAHRAHASTEGITKYLTSAAGFLLEKEIKYLGQLLENPKKPFVAILGGAKVSDKIMVIENLLNKVDSLIIGGGMAYTFLKVQGKEIGNSKFEAERVNVARDILSKAKGKGVNIYLPIDNIVADRVDPAAIVKLEAENIPSGWIGLDIGPKTVKLFNGVLKDAKTIVWNGPLGVFEMAPFAKGTTDVAKFISKLRATKVIGGGDTAACIAKLGLANKMTHVSTGGGASLEFLEGKVLPGIAALTEK